MSMRAKTCQYRGDTIQEENQKDKPPQGYILKWLDASALAPVSTRPGGASKCRGINELPEEEKDRTEVPEIATISNHAGYAIVEARSQAGHCGGALQK